MKKLKLNFQSNTQAGVKPENQDACSFHIPSSPALDNKGIVAVIADGVSASEKAKDASACCVQSFLSDYYSTPDSWSTEHSASKVISALNNWLHSQSVREQEHSSMLSTMSVLIVKSNTAHIFHVGDSRIYRFRDGKLKQLTQDHVLHLAKEKTYLARAMGFDLKVHVDYSTTKVKLNDVFLMTTDGVHDYLTDKTLCSLLGDEISADELSEKALTAGSQDNISAIICKVEQLPDENLSETFDKLTKRPIPPDLEKGMKINGFVVESLIHASNRTQIYLAKDSQTNESVVLKTPSINFEDDAQYLQHFMYEEWVGQRIQSANVVKTHSSSEESKFLAYAMEYVEGQTLRQWMQDNPQPDIKVVITLVKQIIQGLRAFHRQEMLHCDLKPENIMINKIGQVKLIDFGSARIAGVAELISPVAVIGNQGTQGYTAPEVILSEKVTQASDQFSLGVIVYEMFASQLPYQNKLDKDLTAKKLSQLTYESILKHDPHVPIWIDGAIHKACHLNGKARYEALSEFLFDLEHPNQIFVKTVQTAEGPEFELKKYKVLIAISFAINILLLLLLLVR